MKSMIWLPLLLLTSAPLCAKPKVDVKIKVNEGMGRDSAQDSLTKSGASSTTNTTYASVFYLNVTVTSANAEAVAKNNGQWCITGDTGLDSGAEYNATLGGNSLEVEILQKNGKTKKKTFAIFDHKWRKLADL